MRSIILLAAAMLFLPLTMSAAETFYVLKDGVYSKVLDFPPGSKVIIGDAPIPPTDPPTDPPSTNLEEKVYRAALAVGDAGGSKTIGTGYKTAANELDDGKSWVDMTAFAKTFRALAASLSSKQSEFTAMFIELDKQIALSPKTSATLLSVSKGFEKASAAGVLAGDDGASNIEWIKLLDCLPCILNAFLNAEEQAALKAEIDAAENSPTLAPLPPVPAAEINGHIKYPSKDVSLSKAVSILLPYKPIRGARSLDDVMAGKIGHWSTRTPAAHDRFMKAFNARTAK